MTVRLIGIVVGIALVGFLAVGLADRLTTQAAREPLRVAAAADLRLALSEIARVYEARTGTKVVLSFGSTGQLTQQIENGAPFDVFLAANEAFIERLRQGGQTAAGTERRYARGRLALVAAPQLGRKLERLTDLEDPSIRYVAIANPAHAPYGLAARQALEASGLWETLRPKLVYGENIQQTMQYVQSGQADAGLVALALAQPSDLPWTLVPQELHQPLDQALAVMAHSRQKAEARAFTDFVLGPDGQAILERYGFEPPGGGR
jgi:molybdate transport system substrate-binding protein